ncbi:GNAT family N-acetyltransferase [Kribbella qitaiheensis]|uniref:GNAT family N-acetyltransferase n=1 Tax=Kribbella qitaiheensis TaxID=1544730 RepID=UPI001FE81E24|nr:GNAT family N-acetyltransferase [Kribbella qitaiheensis]
MGYDVSTLELRRWRVADALRLTTAHQDPEMATQGGIRDRATAVDWIGRVADLDNGHVYAVADADDHPVGCVAVTNIDRHQVGWTWYWTIADVRSQGVARDALRALVDWAHHDAGLYRLELGHRLNNPASCGLLVRRLQCEQRFGVRRIELAHDQAGGRGTQYCGSKQLAIRVPQSRGPGFAHYPISGRLQRSDPRVVVPHDFDIHPGDPPASGRDGKLHSTERPAAEPTPSGS